ncbi:MAG: 4-hydroxy-3-methylbut-2-enyl diphosphate reductase [Alphaproteobacteria bacterium]|nr:4-hydroxy-3-methylbut-2-enyl diphosphate reductase [Alphaproteobacteria bacterium]
MQDLQVILASPRGFCGGVERAILIVEKALELYGAPVYVRHEIVHNKYVVDNLKAKGAIFVEELDEIPDDVPVIFSAHGVPKSVPLEAKNRKLHYLDATCPLVSKVHRESERLYAEGYHILLIGHKGHPEVIGTMGQLPDGAITLIEDLSQAESIIPTQTDRLSYVTQTTLSVDDTIEMIKTLKTRFPDIRGPKMEDICYATTNRQMAIKAIAEKCDAIIIIGSPNSSNSQRLVETALRHGCKKAQLILRVADIDWDWLKDVKNLGLSAGASAPEILVDEMIEALNKNYKVTVSEVKVADENIEFKLPRELVIA